MKVIYTPRARRHLKLLREYITSRSYRSRADEYVGRIMDFCDGLDTFPKRGDQRDDLQMGLRVVGFERRVTIAFVVRDEEDTVYIAGVYYGGQDYEKHLGGNK